MAEFTEVISLSDEVPRPRSTTFEIGTVTQDAVPLPDINEEGARNYLTAQSWPNGLQDQFLRSCRKIPIRFVIVDDSGSMSAGDGRRLVSEGSKKGFVNCSRWSELTESLRFHVLLAEEARAPTEFRLLNGGAPVMVGFGNDHGEGRNRAMSLLDSSPGGCTPLCAHIHAIVEQIKELAPQLHANDQKAVLVIASDGEASDGDIAHAMKPLQYLPVWVVVRLCTNEEKICTYWSEVDKQLEVDMDVLDDYESEAVEIGRVNDWLTYGEPLHRLREFGVTMKDLDLLDETCLVADQMRNVIAMITTGGKASDIPHPELDWEAFVEKMQLILEEAPLTWCPLVKDVAPWVRMW
eukprot:CAMPEP_0182417848 /NCGR_PEP_ID=MMETSP1167-20130531/2287_1 /TAXON_ID=2988 /ORGANISM="Mallomonas Sp, Strain CCMP3275" /LENGTH=350 /DNA_ID=CAMNT_0024591657 /DNA_START=200 /DNA_END=1249 /DNA_ORIENTATION=-